MSVGAFSNLMIDRSDPSDYLYRFLDQNHPLGGLGHDGFYSHPAIVPLFCFRLGLTCDGIVSVTYRLLSY